jgi:hypothetical protein
MAKLKAKTRNALPNNDFAVIKHIDGHTVKKYPIEDIKHARNALSRVAQSGTPQEKAAVRRKVHAKYPSVGQS